jgi:hypothetical protein
MLKIIRSFENFFLLRIVKIYSMSCHENKDFLKNYMTFATFVSNFKLSRKKEETI